MADGDRDAGRDMPGPRPGHYPRPAVPPRPPSRPATPSPAQQRLTARIESGRRARRRRAALAAGGLMSALVLVLSGGAWALTGYVNGNVGRVNAGTAGTPPSGPLNILLAGVDRRAGLTPAQEVQLHVGHVVSANSDTMMLIHLSADHTRVTMVSFPRDSWVDIPGHGMNKINAAYGLGGPKLMVQTAEQATGLTINDYIEVNFLGFVRVIDALGGVDICLPQPLDDSYSGLHLSAGRHRVTGITALKYARDRHSFATGDLARIDNQQRLLASLLNEAVSGGTLANPVRLSRFLTAALAAIRVDNGLNVAALADQMRGISTSKVAFTTVPIADANYTAPDGQSAVQWDSAAASRLFSAIGSDQPLAAPPRTAAKPAPVRIDVYNGTLIGGLSASTGAQLAQLGFQVRAGLTWPRQNVGQTVIYYRRGQLAAARQVRAVFPGAVLRQRSGPATIRVVLGTNGYQVAAPSPAAGASGVKAKTAAQNACR